MAAAGKEQVPLDPEAWWWTRMAVGDGEAGGCAWTLAHGARGDRGINAAVPPDRTFAPDTRGW